MNIKWEKIKAKVFTEKLSEIDQLLLEIEQNVSNLPRTQWINPIKSWTSKQVSSNSLKLNIEEYSKLNKIIEKLNEIFTTHVNCQLPEHICKFREAYLDIINKKEDDLKLEVASELVEENKLPLDTLVEWYLVNQDLPPKQFNEALGEFWGDLWKQMRGGAAQGAGVGALAGGLSGGTFAGAGLGGLVGGLAGGLYGGGKHLLKKVWNYRKNQVDFDKTKEEAVRILKKLKDQSNKFEMDANFKHLLDSMINQLGTTKAYKVAQPPQVQQQQQIPQHSPEVNYHEPNYDYEPEDRYEEDDEIAVPLPPSLDDETQPEVKKVKDTQPKDELPKLGHFKNLHDLMRYYDANPEQVAVLGHIINEMGWANEDIDDIEFEQLNNALEGTEHLHVPEKLAAFEHGKEIGVNYLKKLKERFGLTHPVGTHAIEYSSITNKYLKLLREQIS